MKPEELCKSFPEKRKWNRLGVLILLVLFGGVSGTEYSHLMEVRKMNEMMYVIVAAIFAGMMTWKPKFEVQEAPSGLHPVNWFNLKRDTTAQVRVKQLYFGVGQSFMNAGLMIPAGCHDKLLCLVVADAEIEVETANKGRQTWFMSLITQSAAGDLYRYAVEDMMSNKLQTIEEKDALDMMAAGIPSGELDCFAPAGSYKQTFTIAHEQHPTNPTRSLYKVTDWTS